MRGETMIPPDKSGRGRKSDNDADDIPAPVERTVVNHSDEEPRPIPPDNLIVMGILQNPWFRAETPQRYIHMYRTNQRFRMMVLAQSRTGQILRQVFGDLYEQIWWENASPLHGDTREYRSRPDSPHVAEALVRVRPNIVVMFGKCAAEAVMGVPRLDRDKFPPGKLPNPFHVIETVHPSARGNTRPELRRVAVQVREILGC